MSYVTQTSIASYGTTTVTLTGEDARPLHFADIDGTLYAWCRDGGFGQSRTHELIVLNDYSDIPEGAEYIGTSLGQFGGVAHLFWRVLP